MFLLERLESQIATGTGVPRPARSSSTRTPSSTSSTSSASPCPRRSTPRSGSTPRASGSSRRPTTRPARIAARAQEQAAYLIGERGPDRGAREAEGRQIVAEAMAAADDVRLGADEYAAEILETLEAEVRKALAGIEKGIDVLAGPPGGAPRRRGGRRAGRAPTPDATTKDARRLAGRPRGRAGIPARRGRGPDRPAMTAPAPLRYPLAGLLGEPPGTRAPLRDPRRDDRAARRPAPRRAARGRSCGSRARTAASSSTPTITTAIAGTCSRCLRDIEIPMTGPDPRGGAAERRHRDGPRRRRRRRSRRSTRLTDHHELDFAALAAEAISLEEPIAPLCEEACPGLCIDCGERLGPGSRGARATTTSTRAWRRCRASGSTAKGRAGRLRASVRAASTAPRAHPRRHCARMRARHAAIGHRKEQQLSWACPSAGSPTLDRAIDARTWRSRCRSSRNARTATSRSAAIGPARTAATTAAGRCSRSRPRRKTPLTSPVEWSSIERHSSVARGHPARGRRHGRRPRPRRGRPRRARPRRAPIPRITSSSSATRRASPRSPPRPALERRDRAGEPGHRDARAPGAGAAREEGLLDHRRLRPRQERPGRRDRDRGPHRRRDGRRDAPDRAAARRRSAGARGPDGPRGQARSCSSTSAPTPTRRRRTCLQYARMGAIFAERVVGIPSPRVALLSIGEEKGKGDLRIQRTTELLDFGFPVPLRCRRQRTQNLAQEACSSSARESTRIPGPSHETEPNRLRCRQHVERYRSRTRLPFVPPGCSRQYAR